MFARDLCEVRDQSAVVLTACKAGDVIAGLVSPLRDEPAIPSPAFHGLKLPIQQPILHRLGDVHFADVCGTFHISQRAGDAANFVVRPRAQPQFIHRLFHQEQATSSLEQKGGSGLGDDPTGPAASSARRASSSGSSVLLASRTFDRPRSGSITGAGSLSNRGGTPLPETGRASRVSRCTARTGELRE